MLEGFIAPSGVQKLLCTISGSQNISKSKLKFLTIQRLEILCPKLFYLYSSSFMFYRKGSELEACLRNSALKRGMFKPSKMCITREIIDKMRPYQIFKILKIFFDNNFKILKSDTPSCFAYISVPLYHTEKLLYSRRSYVSLLSKEI